MKDNSSCRTVAATRETTATSHRTGSFTASVLRILAVSSLVVMASVVVVLTSSLAQAGGIWNNASEVTGTATLNVGGGAQVNAVSCTAPGSCSAIGSYSTTAAISQVFVLNETRGTWGSAVVLPGFIALNTGGVAGTGLVISCSSAGNCGAGGSYADSAGDPHAFVANEIHGTWGSAVEVPGFAILNTGGLVGSLLSISCASNGNCSAGGVYGDTSDNVQAFVVNETGGTWGDAEEVPGSGGLNAGNAAFIGAMSCSSAGNCGAGGYYTDASNDGQAFVVNETGATWGNAIEVPGTSTLNAGGTALVDSIACPATGSCTAVGDYLTSAKVTQAFTVDESAGTWASAAPVTGVNASGATSITSLACASVGNCTAGGGYNDVNGNSQAFTLSETSGVWGAPSELAGSGSLNAGNNAAVEAIACTLPGDCSVTGYYNDASNNQQAFVANQSDGIFASAIEIPGTGALNTDGNAFTGSISCGVDGACSTGGYYEDSSQNYQSFVVNSAATFKVPPTPRVKVDSVRRGVLSVTVLNPSATGGRPILDYQYSLNGGGWRDVPGRPSVHIRIDRLTALATYRVSLRAVNAVGIGAASRVVRLAVQ